MRAHASAWPTPNHARIPLLASVVAPPQNVHRLPRSGPPCLRCVHAGFTLHRWDPIAQACTSWYLCKRVHMPSRPLANKATLVRLHVQVRVIVDRRRGGAKGEEAVEQKIVRARKRSAAKGQVRRAQRPHALQREGSSDIDVEDFELKVKKARQVRAARVCSLLFLCAAPHPVRARRSPRTSASLKAWTITSALPARLHRQVTRRPRRPRRRLRARFRCLTRSARRLCRRLRARCRRPTRSMWAKRAKWWRWRNERGAVAFVHSFVLASLLCMSASMHAVSASACPCFCSGCACPGRARCAAMTRSSRAACAVIAFVILLLHASRSHT